MLRWHSGKRIYLLKQEAQGSGVDLWPRKMLWGEEMTVHSVFLHEKSRGQRREQQFRGHRVGHN